MRKVPGKNGITRCGHERIKKLEVLMAAFFKRFSYKDRDSCVALPLNRDPRIRMIFFQNYIRVGSKVILIWAQLYGDNLCRLSLTN